jgi:hypothetical protein
LCEKFIEYSSHQDNNKLEPILNSIYFDIAWICANSCIEYASASNETYMLMQDNSYLKILPIGAKRFLIHGIENESSFDSCFQNYQNQTNRDIKLRQKYIVGETFELDFKKHIALLDNPMKENLGISYSEILYLLTSISISTEPITSPGKIPMVDKEKYMKEFSTKGGFPYESVKKLFKALTLTKQILKNEPREIWNYKQQNRVSKKPFLQINYHGKDCLLWSDQKLKGFLTLLDSDVTFKNFPKELSNPSIDKAIDKISNKAGKWFELQVIAQMKKLNIFGATAKDRIISKISNTQIECSAGEIDFIGLSENDSSIIILECKMINSGFEARGFRQERDNFMKGKDSYIIKLIRKVNWVFDNYETIMKILSENYYIDQSKISRRVLCGFITYFTTMIPCFVDLFPCISLVEFIDRYNSESKWPYPNGIKSNKINEEGMASL